MIVAEVRVCVDVDQLEAALTIDSVTVLIEGLKAKLKNDQLSWRQSFRRGQLYNNDTRGIDCRATPPNPWQLGPDLMKHLKQVSVTTSTASVSTT